VSCVVTAVLTITLGASADIRAASLPDGRAYEIVSPATRHGGDVTVLAGRTRAAADGSAVAFPSLSGFADVHGTGVATEYMSVRSPSAGWLTHAITPLQEPLTYPATSAGLDPLYQGEFSADFSTGVFRSWSALTNAPNVANVPNLYVRRDLRTPGAGTYELESDCPGCTSPLPAPTFSQIGGVSSQPPWFAGASRDFSHVLFESALNLTADASGTDPKLYESDHGVVHLAGVLPDRTPAASSVAGWGASQPFYTPHVISSDGSRVLFTAEPTICGLDDTCGDLDMRINETATIKLADMHRANMANLQSAWIRSAPSP